MNSMYPSALYVIAHAPVGRTSSSAGEKLRVDPMTKLTPEVAAQLLDACKAGAGDAAQLLTAALGCGMQITDVQAADVSPANLPDGLHGPGLALTFGLAEEAVALLLPEATNLLPPWYAAPDADGQAKLQALAEQVSKLLLPETLEVEQSAATSVDDMAAAIVEAKLGEAGGCLQLTVTGDDGQESLLMLWPLTAPASLLQTPPEADDETEAPDATYSQSTPERALPSYLQSLLSVHVPVIVTLAQTKKTVDEIVKLGPGVILQFDKPCDAMLEMDAAGQHIAEGEAVKVGDKFGLRITSIRLPDERFKAVGKT